jgi:hypothetical protein
MSRTSTLTHFGNAQDSALPISEVILNIANHNSISLKNCFCKHCEIKGMLTGKMKAIPIETKSFPLPDKLKETKKNKIIKKIKSSSNMVDKGIKYTSTTTENTWGYLTLERYEKCMEGPSIIDLNKRKTYIGSYPTCEHLIRFDKFEDHSLLNDKKISIYLDECDQITIEDMNNCGVMVNGLQCDKCILK